MATIAIPAAFGLAVMAALTLVVERIRARSELPRLPRRGRRDHHARRPPARSPCAPSCGGGDQDRAAIAAAREELLELAAALRAVTHPSPFAIAMLIRLLTDGVGPLYLPDGRGSLAGAVRAILAELGVTPL